MSRTIAIVGTCGSSQMLAPFNDPDVEIWACSPDNAMGVLPRITKFFEVHGDLDMPGEPDWSRYIQWLNIHSAPPAANLPPPVFELIAQRGDLFPTATILPKDKLLARFGRNWFTSTPAWMMAYAMLLGDVECIWLYGVDMASREEYLWQRPGMHRMIEFAEHDFGIRVMVPLASDLPQPAPLYGYDISTPMGYKLEIRRRELIARLSAANREIAANQKIVDHLTGALDNLDYMQSIWTGEPEPALKHPVPAGEGGKVVNLKPAGA